MGTDIRAPPREAIDTRRFARYAAKPIAKPELTFKVPLNARQRNCHRLDPHLIHPLDAHRQRRRGLTLSASHPGHAGARRSAVAGSWGPTGRDTHRTRKATAASTGTILRIQANARTNEIRGVSYQVRSEGIQDAAGTRTAHVNTL